MTYNTAVNSTLWRCIINIVLRHLFLLRLLEGTSKFWDWG